MGSFFYYITLTKLFFPIVKNTIIFALPLQQDIMKKKPTPMRIVFVNTKYAAESKASSKLQYGEYDCNCGRSFAVKTRSTIWVACPTCKKNNP